MKQTRMEWTGGFLRYLYLRFNEDKLSNIAATLTLTSLLALVPLLAVTFSLFAALPFMQDIGDDIQSFIFNNFVPSFSENIQETIQGFVIKASDMKTIGFSSLVVTVILLLRTIDTAFNQIWRTKQQRKAIVSFAVYWVVLILGPLLLGLSIVVSSYFYSLLLFNDTTEQLGTQLTIVLPWLLTTLGLSILYMAIPNTRVKFLHALSGAVIAGLLFEVAKRLFTVYITGFPVQEIIFGALSAVPLFLIWVYISWVIVLLGAEICHGIDNFNFQPVEVLGDENYFLDCLTVLQILDQQSDINIYPDNTDLLELIDGSSDSSIYESLKELQRIKLIKAIDKGRYKITADLDNYSIQQYISAVKWKIPSREIIKNSYYSDKLLGKELIDIINHISKRATYSLKQLHHPA